MEFYNVTFKNPSTITVTANITGNTLINTFYYKKYTEIQAVYQNTLLPMFLLDNKYYTSSYAEICETTDESLVEKIINAYGLSLENPSVLNIYQEGSVKETVNYVKYSELKVKCLCLIRSTVEGEEDQEVYKELDLYKLNDNYYVKEEGDYKFMFDNNTDRKTAFQSIFEYYSVEAIPENNVEIIDEDGDVLETFEYSNYIKYIMKYTKNETEKDNEGKEKTDEWGNPIYLEGEYTLYGDESEYAVYYSYLDITLEDKTDDNGDVVTDGEGNPVKIEIREIKSLFSTDNTDNEKLESIISNLSLSILDYSYIYIYRYNGLYPSITLTYHIEPEIEWTKYTLVYTDLNQDECSCTIYEGGDYYYDEYQSEKLVGIYSDDKTLFETLMDKLSIGIYNPSTIYIYAASDESHETPIKSYTNSYFEDVKFTIIVNNEVQINTLKYQNYNYYVPDDTDTVIFSKGTDQMTMLSYFTSNYTLDNPSKVTIYEPGGGIFNTLNYIVYTELVMKIENGGTSTTKTLYYLDGKYYNEDKTKTINVDITDTEKIEKFTSDFEFSIDNNSEITISQKNGGTIIETINYVHYTNSTFSFTDSSNNGQTVTIYRYENKYYKKDGAMYQYLFDKADETNYQCDRIKDEFSVTFKDPCEINLKNTYDPKPGDTVTIVFNTQGIYDTKINLYLTYFKSGETDSSAETIYYSSKDQAFYKKNDEGIDYTEIYKQSDTDADKITKIQTTFSVTLKDPSTFYIIDTDGLLIYDTVSIYGYTSYYIRYIKDNNAEYSDVLYKKGDAFYDKEYNQIATTSTADDDLVTTIITAYSITLWDPSYFIIEYYNSFGIKQEYKKIEYGKLSRYSLGYTRSDGFTCYDYCYKDSSENYYLNRKSNTEFAVTCTKDEIVSKIGEAYNCVLQCPSGIYLYLNSINGTTGFAGEYALYNDGSINARFKIKYGNNDTDIAYCDGYINGGDSSNQFNYFTYNGKNNHYNYVNYNYSILKYVITTNDRETQKVYYCYSTTGEVRYETITCRLEDKSTNYEINIKMTHYYEATNNGAELRLPEEWHKKPIIVDYSLNTYTNAWYKDGQTLADYTTTGEHEIRTEFDNSGSGKYMAKDSRIKSNYAYDD